MVVLVDGCSCYLLWYANRTRESRISCGYFTFIATGTGAFIATDTGTWDGVQNV